MSRVVVFNLCILSLNLSLLNTAFSVTEMGTINKSNVPESIRGKFHIDPTRTEGARSAEEVSSPDEDTYTCAEGTTSYYTSYYHGNYLQCQCPEGSVINPGEPLSACSLDCPEESRPSGEIGEGPQSMYCVCNSAPNVIVINRDTTVCEGPYNPDEDINPLADEKANQACREAQKEIEINNCTSLKVNVNMPDYTNSGSSMEGCRSLRLRAQNINASTTNEIARCNQVITNSKISSRCSPKAASTARSKLRTKGDNYYITSRSLEVQVDRCIAAFKQDPDPQQTSQGSSVQASRKTNWSGLAQTAAQAFESLNGSGLEASVDGGELGSSSNPPHAESSPSFKQFNNNNGGLRESPYSRFNDEDLGGFNGDGDPEDSIQNPQRTHGNKNPRNQASQAGLTAQRSHGGPSGVNGGGSEVEIMVVASLLPQMLIKEVKPEEGLLQLRKETWF